MQRVSRWDVKKFHVNVMSMSLMSIDEFQERFTDIDFHGFAKGGIEPNKDSSRSGIGFW